MTKFSMNRSTCRHWRDLCVEIRKSTRLKGPARPQYCRAPTSARFFMNCYDEWRKVRGKVPRGPAARVANKFTKIFRDHTKIVLEQSELTPALASLTPDRRVRQKTWNWQPAHWNEDGSSEHYNMHSEVTHYLKQHEGEARVWQTEPEQWLPLVTRDHGQPAATEGLAYHGLGENGMGNKYDGTTIGVTHADRAQEFYKSHSGFKTQRRLVTEFGPTQKSDDLDGNLQPDINSAVSTFVVRGKKGSEVLYWLRQVRVITLPEVYANFQHDVPFADIYDAWQEGACVIRSHPPRGVVGSVSSWGSGVQSQVAWRRRGWQGWQQGPSGFY